MGMACSSEVRAAAAIAEDVGFDSLPCPQFSDLFLIWCPHHSWVSNNHSKTSQLTTGQDNYQFLMVGHHPEELPAKPSETCTSSIVVWSYQGFLIPCTLGNYKSRTL